jgi:hypothetical protein
MSFISELINPIMGVIGKVIPDADLLIKVKAELIEAGMKAESELARAGAEVIMAEAKGESPAQRNWRPHLMYLIMAVIVFNAIIVPVSASFGYVIPTVDALSAIPEQLWSLLTLGMGGYIAGRSAEKIAATIAPMLKKSQ